MAQITITIPDDKVDRIRDAFAAEFNWSPSLGVTKTQFTKDKVIEYTKQVTRNYEAGIAADIATQAKYAEINAISIT